MKHFQDIILYELEYIARLKISLRRDLKRERKSC